MDATEQLHGATRASQHIQTSPLAHSHLQVTIDDLLAVYELRHVFHNAGAKAMEAVYTFPVPLDAAFLGMEAVLAGERRVAEVLPAREATREYDDALAEGDSAVLLERIEQGLLCVNLGNLKPGEDGEITLRFVAALGVADSRARFSLPLVHRPRYGKSWLDELVEPEHDFALEHPLQARICVRGLLARCPVQCAAPGAKFRLESDQLVLELDGAMLDRDFVLGFDLPEEGVSRARWVADGDQSIAVLSFVPKAPPMDQSVHALDLCLVLDGSGSMEGDAIAQSRHALAAVAQALDEADRIQVLRFGSTVSPLFRRPLKASPRVRESLAALSATVQADLGGTDMGTALEAAIKSLEDASVAQRLPVVILVTDGAVQPSEIEAAQQRARDAGVRIFVVAVGSSAGVDVLAPLTSATLGTLERAVPTEPVDAAVMRQFRRARARHPLDVQIQWGAGIEGVPLGVVYPGDAVTAVARIPDQSTRTVTASLPDNSLTFALDELNTSPDWRAWAGQQCYLHATGSAKADLAFRYGLITQETSAVLVKVRADGEKIVGLPRIVPVAHMAAHGLHLSGSFSDVHAFYSPCMDDLDTGELDNLTGLPLSDLGGLSDGGRHGAEATPVSQAGGRDQEQARRAERLLLHALLDVLTRDIDQAALTAHVMGCIAKPDRPLVEQYLSGRCLSLQSRHAALMLLKALYERHDDEEFTDDQEAALATFAQELEHG